MVVEEQASSDSSSGSHGTGKSRKAPKSISRKTFQAYRRLSQQRSSKTILLFVASMALFGFALWLGIRLATLLVGRSFLSKKYDPLDHMKDREWRDHPELFESDMPDHPQLHMDWNPLYRIPESIPIVGDRSDRYVELRKQMDALLPKDDARSLARVQELQSHSYTPMPMNEATIDQEPYDIYNCPPTPPKGYPYDWNILQILEHWPPDDPTPRPNVYQSFCIFDYQKDYDKAMAYRTAEVPFLVVNDPAVARTVERWNVPGYMERLLSDGPHRCEYSANNHFMYYVTPSKSQRKAKPDWKPPTKLSRMMFTEWLHHADQPDSKVGPDQPHWYYRLIGCGLMGNEGTCDTGASEYLYDELPFFQPKKSLYLVEPETQGGIHCRFGMKGVIAENHFDANRNMIAVLGGSRRYIMAHPKECPNLALYPKGTPSARHSEVDWSDPDLDKFPQFAHAMAHEVVLQPGQVMYLPTFWFHYIISLELNYQCNTRSGSSTENMDTLHRCGF